MRSPSQLCRTLESPVSGSQMAMAELVVPCVNPQDIYLVHRLLLDLGSGCLLSCAWEKV